MVLVVSLVEEPHSKAWVYLADSSDSFSPPIMLRKKRPSIHRLPYRISIEMRYIQDKSGASAMEMVQEGI
jgi:hypothetical protein